MSPAPPPPLSLPAVLELLAFLALLVPALGGCATLDHGVLDEVAVVTNPPGARIVSSTGTICISPCAVSGPRLESFVVTASKPGYATATATSFNKPDEAATAAASKLEATPDFLGRVIDVQDGSYSTHDPKVLVMNLDKAP